MVKGLDIEEAILTLLAAVFLATHAADFAAPANRSSARRAVDRGVRRAFGRDRRPASSASSCAARGSPIDTRSGRWRSGSSATAPVALPHRIDTLLSPALLAVGIGIALSVLLARVPARGRRAHVVVPPDVARRARFLVERYGTDSLSYFALRSDKEWFGYRDTVVAYRVHNGIALVSPDPVGPVVAAGRRVGGVPRVRRRARLVGRGDGARAPTGCPCTRASGMHDLYIGDEAVVDVRRFSLDGKQNKSLRQSVGRVRKAGLPGGDVRPRAARARARAAAARR